MELRELGKEQHILRVFHLGIIRFQSNALSSPVIDFPLFEDGDLNPVTGAVREPSSALQGWVAWEWADDSHSWGEERGLLAAKCLGSVPPLPHSL